MRKYKASSEWLETILIIFFLIFFVAILRDFALRQEERWKATNGENTQYPTSDWEKCLEYCKKRQ